MKLLTVRLTDEEYARLRGLAGEGTISDVVRGWIEVMDPAMTVAELDKTAARLRAEPKVKPPFLAAPDDDCSLCGHDRHEFHLGPTCQAPIAQKASRAIRCGCRTFIAAAEDPL